LVHKQAQRAALLFQELRRSFSSVLRGEELDGKALDKALEKDKSIKKITKLRTLYKLTWNSSLL
jgi:hypothetical protein